MKVAVGIALVVVVVLIALAFASGGKPSREAPEWLTAAPIAHRGQWTDGPEAPENSLAAFDEAAVNGFPVELDVHRSADGVIVVIHDEELERVTGETGAVSESQAAYLTKLRLLGGEETIPTLQDALDLVDGRVPVFVEIKNPGEVGALEDELAEMLSAYDGEVAVMSFNPFSLQRVAERAPEIPRGQLASAFEGEDLAWYEKLLLRNLLMNWASKPDFIAYDIAELPSPVTTLQRWRGRPLLGWTADTPEEREAAAAHVDQVICNPGALPER